MRLIHRPKRQGAATKAKKCPARGLNLMRYEYGQTNYYLHPKAKEQLWVKARKQILAEGIYEGMHKRRLILKIVPKGYETRWENINTLTKEKIMHYQMRLPMGVST